jgi:hypothetical protein
MTSDARIYEAMYTNERIESPGVCSSQVESASSQHDVDQGKLDDVAPIHPYARWKTANLVWKFPIQSRESTWRVSAAGRIYWKITKHVTQRLGLVAPMVRRIIRQQCNGIYTTWAGRNYVMIDMPETFLLESDDRPMNRAIKPWETIKTKRTRKRVGRKVEGNELKQTTIRPLFVVGLVRVHLSAWL